jgi:peptide-methionine (R)-S-oxide reductase
MQRLSPIPRITASATNAATNSIFRFLIAEASDSFESQTSPRNPRRWSCAFSHDGPSFHRGRESHALYRFLKICHIFIVGATTMFVPPQRQSGSFLSRRTILSLCASGLLGLALWHFRKSSSAEATSIPSGPPPLVTIVEFSDSGERLGAKTLLMVRKSDEDWRSTLSAGAYDITRRTGTEFAFSGEYWNFHDKGFFRCICCSSALFSSDTKFDSGTGWPSFWAPIAAENISETTDRSFGISRTAVSCRLCTAHLGHVFEDGPPPSGLRYCINSVALRFVKAV